MTIYILGLMLSMCIAWAGIRTTLYENRKIYIVFLSALPLILIAGLRHYSVGNDTPTYYLWFYRIANGMTSESLEWLYVLLNRVLGKLGFEYTGLFIVSAAILCLLSFWQIFDDSPDIVLSIFLFFTARFYLSYYNLLRQLLSAAILLFSVRYVERRDLKRFLLSVIIAAGFHATAYTFLVVYWLAGVKMSPKSIIIGMLLVMVLGRTPMIMAIINTLTQTRYAGYALHEATNSLASFGKTFAVQIAVLVIALMFYEDSRKYRTYLNLQVITVWVTSLTGSIELIERMRYTFGLPSIILLPMAINNIKDRRIRLLISVAVVGGFALYGYQCLKNDVYWMVPYKAFWKS